MNRSYLSCVVTFLCSFSLCASATEWEQSRQQVAVATSLSSNSNLFNALTAQQSASRLQGILSLDHLTLFEGFGIALPAKVWRQHYSTELLDDETLYHVTPELRFFLSDSTDLALQTEFNRQQYLQGDEAAEFLRPDELSMIATQQKAALALSMGRAPDVQNLQIKLGTERSSQSASQRDLFDLDADFVGLEYSHKLNENVALVTDLERRQEQQGQTDTDINSLGVGLAVHWTGNQWLELIVGRFNRQFAADIASADGVYWKLTNHYQLNADWLLQLSSERRSVLSFAEDSLSQLDTVAEVSLQWRLSDSHLLTGQVNRTKSALEQREFQRTRWQYGLNWLWQVSDQWQTDLGFNQVRRQRDNELWRQRNEFSFGVRWVW